MSKKKTRDSYEVGYGKPPKDTQFQKGISGNLKGRPKKCRNFYEVLIRESESLMPLTENGQRKRLSKDEVAIKRLMNQAISGKPSAQRMCFPLRQQAVAILDPGYGRLSGWLWPEPQSMLMWYFFNFYGDMLSSRRWLPGTQGATG